MRDVRIEGGRPPPGRAARLRHAPLPDGPIRALRPCRRPVPSTAGVGVGFALIAMGFFFPAAAPLLNPTFVGEVHVIGGTWVVAQAVFGVVLGLAVSRLAGAPVRR